MLKYYLPIKQQSGGADTSFQYIFTKTIGGTTTEIQVSGSSEFYFYDSSGGQHRREKAVILHLDAPNTTSAIRYSYKFRNPHSTNDMTICDGGTHYAILEAFETDESYQ